MAENCFQEHDQLGDGNREAPVSKPNEHSGIGALHALLRRGNADPATVAALVRERPEAKAAMYALLHSTLGSAVPGSRQATNPFQPQPQHQQHTAAIDRMYQTLRLGDYDAGAITTTLIPAYVAARDARDVDAVSEIGGRLVGSFIRMNSAKAAVAQMRAITPHKSIQGSDADQDVQNFQRQQYVDNHAAELDQKVSQATILAMVAMVPHQYQGKEVAGVAPLPVTNGPPEELRARLVGELDRTREILIDIQTINGLIAGKDRSNEPHGHGSMIDRGPLDRARSLIWRWSSRPIDLAFMKAALGPSWNILEATAPAHSKPSDALDEATKQAKHTGWLGDTGEFTIDDAQLWINLGGVDNVAIVLRKLYTTDPDTRARLLVQMKQRNLLHKFCSTFGWEPIKELHDSLGSGHGEIKSDLQRYFIGGKDKWGPSLGSEWESHNNSVHHHVGRLGIAGDILNFVFDLATFGVNSNYGKLRDAHTSGQMSDEDYSSAKKNLAAHTSAVAIASLLTGGLADKVVRGGAATVSTARAIGAGAAGGSAGAVGGLAAGDIYNMATGQQEGFSSIEDYMTTAMVGGAFGGGMGAVTKGLSARFKKFFGKKALDGDEAAASTVSSASVIKNPRIANAASKAGIDGTTLSEPQLGMLEASEAAIASGEVRAAVKIGDDLVASGVPKAKVIEFENAIAQDVGKTSPHTYRNPTATLPDGTPTPPSVQGGPLFHGTDTPPEVVFQKGLPTRGNNTGLLDHAQQAPDSAFRGTTREILSPDRQQGAGQWAGEDGYVYKIDGTPSWDMNAKLDGKVKLPDGSYTGNPMKGEAEQAVLANVPTERIVGAYKMRVLPNGKLAPGPMIPNPNYKPIP